ncbi:hypothetical protein P256_01981 [Acinetobacter nectaris CIP 110549]|uniref:Glycosyltransferase 2-like domain-containing protein n=1 Tax=Acinetobacter nectaris CIP 110549 TaxID=1392540 RepID=V2TM60_9GAMM|nr:glycosyltransferase [Acinetobacter nectaris]ESK38442.1 hypothetical protein P256_01981 [Acinetobacter nectaris CIP 110549]
MILSLIVPVYNVEEYISDFFYSIAYQMHEDVEIIIINDGTEDNSIHILLNLIKEIICPNLQANFTILSQANSGQSSARNYGIKEAKGRYIGFVDPDDIVAENFISLLLHSINLNNDTDVFHYNAKKINESGTIILGDINYVDKDQSFIAEKKYLLAMFEQDIWYPWLRVFKRDIISDFQFPINLLLEDKYLFPKIYVSRVNKITEINSSLVLYRIRGNSSLNNKDKQEKILESLCCGMKEYKDSNNDLLYSIYLQYFWSYLYDISKFNFKYIFYRMIGFKKEYCSFINVKSKKEMLVTRFPIFFVLFLKFKRLLGTF